MGTGPNIHRRTVDEDRPTHGKIFAGRELSFHILGRRIHVVGAEMKMTLAIGSPQAVSIAAYQAANVFAPLVLAVFIIAIAWPTQQWLQSHMPSFSQWRSR